MNYGGKWPAIVRVWDRPRRECRVEIPGITDGADLLPLAQIAYALGDQSEDTEIFIPIGSRVWVEFERGDPRYPIITHFRTKQAGNDLLWRRIHHENHEREAFDGDLHDHATQDINTEAGRDKVTDVVRNESRTVGENFVLEAGTKIELIVGGSSIKIEGGAVTITTDLLNVVAPQAEFSGTVHAAVDVLAVAISLLNHLHGGVQSGGSQTSPPV